MIKKRLILITLTCMLDYVQAQTVVWQMEPSDYSSIERISRNLLKVVRNGKIGLINTDGSVVTPAINDNISDFYEHKALVTCSDGHGERISGCLTDNGLFYSYTKKYYTLNGQKFFSDGLLSVKDENDKLGYIDEKGNQIVGFNGKYTRIKPFTEGYATVMRDKKFVLINKDGDEMAFKYAAGKIGAAIAGCTNVYHGKAYVYDEYSDPDRKYYIYDTVKKGPIESTNRVKDKTMDYLYCYQFVTKRGKEVPYEKMEVYRGAKGLAATYSNGAYGYASESNVIVPVQFSSASQFEDGLSIVKINGLMGILKFVEGTGFGISVPKAKHDFYAGNKVSCSFNLTVPNIWHGKKLEVVVKDMNGSAVETTNNADSYTFSTKPIVSGQADYSITVNAEGLRLFEDKISYSFNKRELCATCGKDKSQCEFHGNHPSPTPVAKPTNPCPTCGKNNCEIHCYDCGKAIKDCKYRGVH